MSKPDELSQQWTQAEGLRAGAPLAGGGNADEIGRLTRLCEDLLREREHLQARIGRLEQEREQCLRSIYALLPKETTLNFDKEAILAEVERSPNLSEVVAQRRRELGQ